MNTVVVGGGKMGLPLACKIADSGSCVTVCDINEKLVEKINQGIAPFEEPGLSELLEKNSKNGRLSASLYTSASVGDADVVIVIVPALLEKDNQFDGKALYSASEEIAKGLSADTLVCYETTVPVGTSRNNFRTILEKSGLKAGLDFNLCFSPERVKSQLVFEKLEETPKIVGGLTQACTDRAARFYGDHLKCEVVKMESLEASEFSKLAGMLYRDVNIALSNELAKFAEANEIDYGKILESVNTDGESGLLIPGIGVGGHCTPVYPYFLIHAARAQSQPLSLAESSRQINDDNPGYYVNKLSDNLGGLEGKRAHILGLGFRPEVKETAFSPAFQLLESLGRLKCSVTLEDPYFSSEEIERYGFSSASVEEARPDMVILNTAHQCYKNIDWNKWKSNGVQAVLDGRNIWTASEVQEAGITYFGIGRP